MLNDLINCSKTHSDISATVEYLSIEAISGVSSVKDFEYFCYSKILIDSQFVDCGRYKMLSADDKSFLLLAKYDGDVADYRAICSLHDSGLTEDQIVTSVSLYLNGFLN